MSYSFNATIEAPDLTDYDLLNASEKLQFEELAGVYKDSEGNVDEDESTSSMTYSLHQDGTISTEKIDNYPYPYSYVTVDEEEALGRSCQLGNDSKNLNFRSFFMRHRCRK